MIRVTEQRMQPLSTLDFSPVEAAFVSGLSVKLVNSMIDRGEVKAARGRRREGEGARRLGFAEVLYLTLRSDLGEWLTAAARKKLYSQLREIPTARRISEPRQLPQTVTLGAVRVSLGDALETATERIALLRESERFVTSDPEVRGGEPVVRGTRVPVAVLADLASQGIADEEILADYPSVTPEALQAALTYAATHPRRGRPRRGPWHTATRRARR